MKPNLFSSMTGATVVLAIANFATTIQNRFEAKSLYTSISDAPSHLKNGLVPARSVTKTSGIVIRVQAERSAVKALKKFGDLPLGEQKASSAQADTSVSEQKGSQSTSTAPDPLRNPSQYSGLRRGKSRPVSGNQPAQSDNPSDFGQGGPEMPGLDDEFPGEPRRFPDGGESPGPSDPGPHDYQ